MNDEATTAEIIKELMVLNNTSGVSSEQVLVWAKKVEAQRAQKEVLENIRDTKDFDSISRDKQRPDGNGQQREGVKEKKVKENCRYCGMTHIYTETMPSIWQNMQQMYKGKLLQSNIQKCIKAGTKTKVTHMEQRSP